MSAMCNTCYFAVDISRLGQRCYGSCTGHFVLLSDMVRELKEKEASTRQQMSTLQEQFSVVLDALLSRLPESALEPLKPGQISALESLVHKRVEVVLNTRNPCLEVPVSADGSVRQTEELAANRQWIYTNGEPGVVRWEIGPIVQSTDALVGDAALTAAELRYENGSGAVDFEALGLVDPNRTTEE